MFTPPFKGDLRNQSPEGRVYFNVPPGMITSGTALTITGWAPFPPGARLEVSRHLSPGDWSDVQSIDPPHTSPPINLWTSIPAGTNVAEFRYVDIATGVPYPFTSQLYSWNAV